MMPRTKQEVKDWAANTEDKGNIVLTKKVFQDWVRKDRWLRMGLVFASIISTLAIQHYDTWLTWLAR